MRAALFAMSPDKAPGPDSMNPKFFQHFWHLMGDDISDFVSNCVSACQFPQGLGKANIVLLPKKQTLETVAELRPIALCNTIYKVIAKLLANRMKDMLRGLIAESQSAFVPNRLITDNILIAAEAGHFLRRKVGGVQGWAGMKLDMTKAYDRMEWDYVRFMLTKFDFANEWVNLIMLCVESAEYDIIINESLFGSVGPSRGLRQGDPLSPYLFILCSEGLSALIRDAEMKGTIHGCRHCQRCPGCHAFDVRR